MNVTLGRVRDLVLHGLGFTPDPRHNVIDTINRAGRSLVAEHSWWWRSMRPVRVTLQNGEILLPDDFLELVSLTNTVGSMYTPQPATIQEVMRLRQSRTVVSDPTFLYALSVSGSGPGGAPRPMLLAAPVNAAPAELDLMYVAAWADIPPTADNGYLLAIVPEAESALVYGARVEAGLIENQTVTPELEKYRAEVSRLKAQDASRQVNHGPMSGGAGRFINASGMVGAPYFNRVIFR